MRYSPAHAAKSGSVPFMLRGPKSLRTVMTAAVAGVIGLVPTVLIASPAHAADGVYSIVDASGTEGGTVTFTISRDPAGVADPLPSETVYWETTDGTATAGDDYTAVAAGSLAGTVTFPAYTNTTVPQTRTVTVTTLQDAVDEPDDESFTVSLSSTVASPNTTFTTSSATGTIADDDNPTFTIVSSPTTVNESTTALQRTATITATLSKPSPYDVTIPLSTVDGTAKAGQDYTAVDDALVVTAGQTLSSSIVIDVADDDIDETAVQSFTVQTSAGTNVTGTRAVTVNIADDDAAPVVDIVSGGTVQEGGTLTFNATLSRQSENTVTARWDTADGPVTPDPTHGTATAGADYTATTSGTVTFAPLAQTPTVPITVLTAFDDVDELTEDLSVKLTQPTNATVGSPSAATGSITDSGTTPGPQVTLTPVEVVEGGTTATRARTFTVRLSKPSGREQKVSYSVLAGTADVGAGIGVASPGEDFTPTQAPVNLTFAPGETEKTFTVDIYGDNVDEGNGENIAIALGDVNGGLAGGLNLAPDNQVTITDDDDKPVISLARTEITMPETDGPAAALFEVKLSNPSSEDVDFEATVATPAGTAALMGTAPGDDDYDVLAGTGSFTAGQTSAYVLFIVNGDEVYEANETVLYNIARINNETDATGGPLAATLTITNDDDAPQLEIVSDDVTEGQTLALTGVVTGVAQDSTLLNVALAGTSMAGKQAAAATDFSPVGFQVTVPAGTTSGTTVAVGNVVITDDTTPEPAETILVSGSGFGNTGSVKDGVLTILASDGGSTDPGSVAPTLTASASFRLGAGTVTLNGTAAAGAAVELWGRTVNATDADYAKISDTTASSSGTFTLMPSLSTDGMYFKVTASELESSPVRVYVKEDPDLSATSPSMGVVRLVVTGDPRVRGLTTRVFRANANGSWTLVGSGILNASGTFTKTLTGQPSGKSYTYRAWVRGDSERGVLTNYSSYTKSVRVK